MNSIMPVETSWPILLGCGKIQMWNGPEALGKDLWVEMIFVFNTQLTEGKHAEDSQSVSVHLLHPLQTVPCRWRRICRWHWRRFLPLAAKTSFCLSPKSYRTTLIWVGWLARERKKKSFKDILHVFTHNLNTLLVKDVKRKGEGKRTEDVNGGWAGDAKAGKTFWDQIRKKKKKN